MLCAHGEIAACSCSTWRRSAREVAVIVEHIVGARQPLGARQLRRHDGAHRVGGQVRCGAWRARSAAPRCSPPPVRAAPDRDRRRSPAAAAPPGARRAQTLRSRACALPRGSAGAGSLPAVASPRRFPNTRRRIRARSRLPSAAMNSGPNCSRIARIAAPPAAVRSCEISSVSTTAAPSCFEHSAAADLPEPMPPVSPTQNGMARQNRIEVVPGERLAPEQRDQAGDGEVGAERDRHVAAVAREHDQADADRRRRPARRAGSSAAASSSRARRRSRRAA